jgi:hypothetical protein
MRGCAGEEGHPLSPHPLASRLALYASKPSRLVCILIHHGRWHDRMCDPATAGKPSRVFSKVGTADWPHSPKATRIISRPLYPRSLSAHLAASKSPALADYVEGILLLASRRALELDQRNDD